jgi:hypothetical protein
VFVNSFGNNILKNANIVLVKDNLLLIWPTKCAIPLYSHFLHHFFGTYTPFYAIQNGTKTT